MGIRVNKYWVVYDSTSMQAIDPQFLNITDEMIEKYMKENPMPKDPQYSPKDLIGDLTESSGFYCIPDGTKKETRNYVVELLEDLR